MNAVVDLKETFDAWLKDFPTNGSPIIDLKSPEVKFSDDPLALSCASYRIFKNTSVPFTDIDSVTATAEDRETAALIRSYYGQKLVWQALQGRSLSEFRTKMGQFLNGEHQLTSDELGMLYRIPYFYDEDCALDKVIANTKPAQVVEPHLVHRRRLNYITCINQYRRANTSRHYWFADENQYAYVIKVLANNSLVPLLESVIARGTLDVNARLYPRSHRGADSDKTYYDLVKFELA